MCNLGCMCCGLCVEVRGQLPWVSFILPPWVLEMEHRCRLADPFAGPSLLFLVFTTGLLQISAVGSLSKWDSSVSGRSLLKCPGPQVMHWGQVMHCSQGVSARVEMGNSDPFYNFCTFLFSDVWRGVVCVCVCARVHVPSMACMWRLENSFSRVGSPFVMWIPGTELRFLCLVARAFTY